MDFAHLAGWTALAVTVGLALFGAGRRLGRRHEATRHDISRREAESEFYYRGLNFLLSDEPDRAIEEFVKLVRINSETVEIYLSLANLFRARGEVGRAIRIHQNIIARPNLPDPVRVNALFGLAEDYRQGGFVDRAADAYRQVLEADPKHHRALAGLQTLHEREGCWDRALEALKRLEKATGRADPRREAHLHVQIGRELMVQGDGPGALARFQTAIKVFPGCVEASRLVGNALIETGQIKAAIKGFSQLRKSRPSHFFLVVEPLRRAFEALDDQAGFEACMREAAQASGASSRLMLHWSGYLEEQGRLDEAVEALRSGLAKDPCSAEMAGRLTALLARQGALAEAVEIARECLNCLTARQRLFQCARCGFKSRDIYWKCPQCHDWDAMEPL